MGDQTGKKFLPSSVYRYRMPPTLSGQMGNVGPQSAAGQWRLPARIAFRFCFVYLSLYSLSSEITLGGLLLPIASEDVPAPGTLPPMRQIVSWVCVNVFDIKLPPVYAHGSVDNVFNWVLMFCLLVFALLGAGVWSALDRQRTDYITLHKWFRLFLRFGLAGQMISFGTAKLIPVQMPLPSLPKLLERYGD